MKTPTRLSAVSLLATASLLAAAPAARAGGYLENYFASTKPGSWARYEMSVTDEKGKVVTTTQTLSRLADVDGNAVLEMRTEPAAGDQKGKEMTIQIHLSSLYVDEKNPLNFANYVERLIMQRQGEKAREMPMAMFRSMGGGLSAMLDYGQNVTRVGEESVDGHDTVHYRASGNIKMKVLFKELEYDYVSDLWLDSSIPFGRVKEHTVTTDSKGKLKSTTDSHLIDSGTSGATSHIEGEIEKIELPPGLPNIFGK